LKIMSLFILLISLTNRTRWNKMKLFFILFIFSNLNFAFAHGENKLGPHAGFIRMPGSFHIEFVPKKDNSFEVYLLDVNNNNPTVNNSSIKIFYQLNNTKIHFSCISKKEHFICKTNDLIDLNNGTIHLKATRLSQKANIAIYNLPLSITTSQHDMNNMQ
jgi:hypothetical protein